MPSGNLEPVDEDSITVSPDCLESRTFSGAKATLLSLMPDVTVSTFYAVVLNARTQWAASSSQKFGSAQRNLNEKFNELRTRRDSSWSRANATDLTAQLVEQREEERATFKRDQAQREQDLDARWESRLQQALAQQKVDLQKAMAQQNAELEQKISELQTILTQQKMWMQHELERKTGELRTSSGQAAVKANKAREPIKQETNADDEHAASERLSLNSHIESQMFMESVISQTSDALNWAKLYRRIEKAQGTLAWAAGLVDNTSNCRAANIWRARVSDNETLNLTDTERLAVAKSLFTGSTDKEASALRLLNSRAGYLVVERFSVVQKGSGSLADGPVVDRIDPHSEEAILLLTSFVRDSN